MSITLFMESQCHGNQHSVKKLLYLQSQLLLKKETPKIHVFFLSEFSNNWSQFRIWSAHLIIKNDTPLYERISVHIVSGQIVQAKRGYFKLRFHSNLNFSIHWYIDSFILNLIILYWNAFHRLFWFYINCCLLTNFGFIIYLY